MADWLDTAYQEHQASSAPSSPAAASGDWLDQAYSDHKSGVNVTAPEASTLGQVATYGLRGLAAIPEKIGAGLMLAKTAADTMGLQNPVTDYLGGQNFGEGMRDTVRAAKGDIAPANADFSTPLAIDQPWAKAHPVASTVGSLAEGVVPFMVPGLGAAMPYIYGASSAQEGVEKLKQNNPGMSDTEALAKGGVRGLAEGLALHYIPKAGEALGKLGINSMGLARPRCW